MTSNDVSHSVSPVEDSAAGTIRESNVTKLEEPSNDAVLSTSLSMSGSTSIIKTTILLVKTPSVTMTPAPATPACLVISEDEDLISFD